MPGPDSCKRAGSAPPGPLRSSLEDRPDDPDRNPTARGSAELYGLCLRYRRPCDVGFARREKTQQHRLRTSQTAEWQETLQLIWAWLVPTLRCSPREQCVGFSRTSQRSQRRSAICCVKWQSLLAMANWKPVSGAERMHPAQSLRAFLETHRRPAWDPERTRISPDPIMLL